jgi:hypothetical protein
MRETGLPVLAEVMGWDDRQADVEFRWLVLMSRLKYDGYQDFLAGVRFLESLAAWLQQFQTADERRVAYAFVRECLIYIGPAEMLRLVELFFPQVVQKELIERVAAQVHVPPFMVWSNEGAAKQYDVAVRRTLFIGLSEGARLDLFRRANAGVVQNDQVVLATYVDRERWDKLLDDLREEIGDPQATFGPVYLIDDFVGSGTTFIRKEKDKWKGKLAAFRDSLGDKLGSHFDPDVAICVHHYIASEQAERALIERQARALEELGPTKWFANVRFSFGMVLPANIRVDQSCKPEAKAFADLARKYFDPDDPYFKKNKHLGAGGTEDVALGFAGCALPLVLEHNTPNNSVALIWAETEGNDGGDGTPARTPIRPLFRRRQRHS